MPFINVKTTEVIDDRKKETLSQGLCQIAQTCLGKGENWVMTGFESEAQLSFRGRADKIAYVEVKCFGTPAADGADAMSGQVCNLLSEELGISPDRIYVSYWGTNMWGWNGANF